MRTSKRKSNQITGLVRYPPTHIFTPYIVFWDRNCSLIWTSRPPIITLRPNVKCSAHLISPLSRLIHKQTCICSTFSILRQNWYKWVTLLRTYAINKCTLTALTAYRENSLPLQFMSRFEDKFAGHFLRCKLAKTWLVHILLKDHHVESEWLHLISFSLLFNKNKFKSQ